MFLFRILAVVVGNFCQTEAFGSTLKRLSAHFGFEIAVTTDVAGYRVFLRKLINNLSCNFIIISYLKNL
jgi:hypothetical protein